MFKRLFKSNKKTDKIAGLKEIENYDISIQSNVKTEQMYNLLSQDKIHLLESLDSTINALNSKRIVKEKQLNSITRDLQEAESKLNICKHNINAYKNKLECSICFDNNIDTVLVPCGHTFCLKCINSSSNCYICKAHINYYQRIYFT